MSAKRAVTPTLDGIAVCTSIACAVHCLTLPILLVAFPAIGVTFFGQEEFHKLLLWFVIPVSVVSLTLGCRQHKDRMVLGIGALGLAVLCFAAILGHDLLGEIGERIATLIGAGIVAMAHLRNFRLCRMANCTS